MFCICVDDKMHKIQKQKMPKNSNSRCRYADIVVPPKINCIEQNKTKDVKKGPKMFFLQAGVFGF